MRELNLRQLIAKWTLGAIVGTALIAVTSPLFLRSYPAKAVDQVRQTHTLPPGTIYRWRSEGYANTHVGPLGMPGKTVARNAMSGARRIALWGDSQAEGVSVADDQKLFARIEQLSGGEMEVFPLAKSGDDLSDWIMQMPLVDDQLGIDHHLFLIADLTDLLAPDQPNDPSSDQLWNLLDTRFVQKLTPAFLIQAVRNIVTAADAATTRQLRFSVGPVTESPQQTSSRTAKASSPPWSAVIERLLNATNKPILIAYAPPSPQIVGGKARYTDDASIQFELLRQAATLSRVKVVNLHPHLCESAKAGRWPHGFHNGQFGAGHLNASGVTVIAQAIVNRIGSER